MFRNLFSAPEPQKHEWILISKTYAAPRRDIAAQLPADAQQKALFGVTTYLWQCAVTGETRKEEMMGSDESQWHEIVDKVDKFGMQYIKDGDKTYAVAQWVPPQEPRLPNL